MSDTLLVTNATILTMNDARPRAGAMFVRRGVIERVGDGADVSKLATPQTRRIDAGGKTIVPGFHDCHLHLLWYGKALTAQADLVGSASIDEVLDRLSTFARRHDGWIVGHGFDQDKLAEGRFPTRADLDRVSPTRPIHITRVCAHAGVANSAAIALLTPEERAAGDAESGLYTEAAINAFHRRVPPLGDAQLEQALLHAMNVALRTGITSVQTMLDTPDQLRVYTRLRNRLGRLPIRVVAMPPESAVESLHAHGILGGFGDAWLRVGGAKFFSDGSLGARTALLAEPYADDPSVAGLRIYPGDTLRRRCAEVVRKGFNVVVHAIGDQALRETIDAIEHVLAGESDAVRRHRIEHASVCPPDQLDRLARMKVATTLQPQFVTSDTWTGERLGPARAAWAYPFASMVRSGIPVGLSSDAPVETLDAFACLAAAVGRHAWSPGETLTPTEAIRAYTLGSAYCGGREHELGSLEPGKFADFAILSADPSDATGKQIRSMRAERVFVDGVEATANENR